MKPLDPVSPGLLVVLGAVPGAWLRFCLVSGGARRLRRPHWATWGVNMLACLLLGLLMGLQPLWEKPTQDVLELALAIGFLGGLSTYSALIAELVTAWRRHGRLEAFLLGLASLLGGLLACFSGLALARVWR
jgi:CrcB protein